MTSRHSGVKIAFGVVFFTGIVFLFGLVVKMLWNAVIPDIFGLPTITYWQAFGLLLLSQILFHGRHGSHFKSHWRDFRWKHHLAGYVAEMTPEERERFRKEWESSCCFTSKPAPKSPDL